MDSHKQQFTAKDFYETLGVAHTASEEEIRSAYKRLSLQYHPEQYKDASQKTAAENAFAHVSEAYQVLSDKDRKVE